MIAMENANFNIFDAVVALTLVVSGVFAFRRGLVREIMALGTWVLAAIFAFSFYPAAKPLLESQIKNELLANAATAIGLFCIAIVILVPLGDYLSSLVKTPTLSSIDRSLGFVFGVIRGFIIMCLVYLAITFTWRADSDNKPAWLEQSRTTSALAYGVDLLKSLVPDSRKDAEDELRSQQDKAQEAIDNAKRLDDISTPIPTYSTKEKNPSSYGNDSRSNMDNLIDRNN